MENQKKATRPDRRQFLKLGALGGASLTSAAVLLGGIPAAFAHGPMCESTETPAQTKGPFYPVSHQLDEDNDLTIVKGHQLPAKGQIVYVEGVVTDAVTCAPASGVLVEIWQACESGRYNHPNDTNPAPIDPDFQYFGKTVTDLNGHYLFKTIIPGAYPADVDWIRPPHIHFRVVKKGFKELITQMYFAGQVLNERDAILQALNPVEQASVIVNLVDADPNHFGPNTKIGEFALAIESVKKI